MPESMTVHIIGAPSLWEAGGRMMQAGNADEWKALISAAEMQRRNRKTINACERKAVKAMKSVRCNIKIMPR